MTFVLEDFHHQEIIDELMIDYIKSLEMLKSNSPSIGINVIEFEKY